MQGLYKSLLKEYLNPYFCPKLYKPLAAVIDAKSKEEASELLKSYLKSEWLRGHRSLHGKPNVETDFYEGYWSFESGAIVKILQLDDTGWEEMMYYPYDMVHYLKNNTK